MLMLKKEDEADPLEIKLKEAQIAKNRFVPIRYDPTPEEVLAYDHAKKRTEELKENDNQR